MNYSVTCATHGKMPVEYLVCAECGYIEKMADHADEAPPGTCPGGCGKPFTPADHPTDFTARFCCTPCAEAQLGQPN